MPSTHAIPYPKERMDYHGCGEVYAAVSHDARQILGIEYIDRHEGAQEALEALRARFPTAAGYLPAMASGWEICIDVEYIQHVAEEVEAKRN